MSSLTSVVLPAPFWPMMAVGRGVQRQADFMEHRRAGPVGEAQLFDLKENGAGLHGDGGRRLDGLDAVQAAGGLLGRDGIASVRQGGAQRTADPRECRGLHPQLLEVGAGEDLLRGIKGDLPALVQQQDAVAVGGNLLDLLLNHQDGDAAAGQLVHGAEHFLAALRVQLGGGFVQHQDVGVHDQHAGDGHALHLAARKVKGVAVAVLPDVQQFEGFLGAAVHLLPGDAQVLHSEGNFLIDVVLGAGKLVEGVLKDKAHLAAQFRDGGGLGGQVLDQDTAAIGALVELGHQTDQGLAQGAFARAVLTDNADELALLDREAQPVQGQRLGVGVAVFEVFHSNHRHWTILHSSAAAIMASSTTVMGVSPRCGVRSAR